MQAAAVSSSAAMVVLTASVAAVVVVILQYIWRPILFAVIAALFLRPIYLQIKRQFSQVLQELSVKTKRQVPPPPPQPSVAVEPDGTPPPHVVEASKDPRHSLQSEKQSVPAPAVRYRAPKASTKVNNKHIPAVGHKGGHAPVGAVAVEDKRSSSSSSSSSCTAPAKPGQQQRGDTAQHGAGDDASSASQLKTTTTTGSSSSLKQVSRCSESASTTPDAFAGGAKMDLNPAAEGDDVKVIPVLGSKSDSPPLPVNEEEAEGGHAESDLEDSRTFVDFSDDELEVLPIETSEFVGLVLLRLSVKGLFNRAAALIDSVPSVGDLISSWADYVKSVAAVVFVALHEFGTYMLFKDGHLQGAGVEVFGVFNAATQLVDKYSPHCLTGIVVGFTTGVALKCIEQQFASSDHDPQEDDSCCTGTAPAGNDDSPTTAPDGTSLPDKKQHDGQSNIVLSTLAESKGQERKSPESRALHLHRKRLNGGRSRKARNRESRGAAKLLKATSGTKLRTESQTMLLRYGVLGRRRRRTIGFVLMGCAFTFALVFAALALLKLFMVYPGILQTLKYVCVFFIARDLVWVLNPERSLQGWISMNHMVKLLLLAFFADIVGPLAFVITFLVVATVLILVKTVAVNLTTIGNYVPTGIATALKSVMRGFAGVCTALRSLLRDFYGRLSHRNRDELHRAYVWAGTRYYVLQDAVLSFLSTSTTVQASAKALLVVAGISAYSAGLLVFLWRILLQVSRMQSLGSSLAFVFDDINGSYWQNINTTLEYFSLDSAQIRNWTLSALDDGLEWYTTSGKAAMISYVAENVFGNSINVSDIESFLRNITTPNSTSSASIFLGNPGLLQPFPFGSAPLRHQLLLDSGTCASESILASGINVSPLDKDGEAIALVTTEGMKAEAAEADRARSEHGDEDHRDDGHGEGGDLLQQLPGVASALVHEWDFSFGPNSTLVRRWHRLVDRFWGTWENAKSADWSWMKSRLTDFYRLLEYPRAIAASLFRFQVSFLSQLLGTMSYTLMSVANFVYEVTVFMTVVSALLHSDADFEVKYLHVLLGFLNIGASTSKVAAHAIYLCVRRTLLHTIKQPIFHFLRVWLLYSLFDVTGGLDGMLWGCAAAFCAVLAVIPTWTMCLPGVVELWLSYDSAVLAAFFASLSFISANAFSRFTTLGASSDHLAQFGPLGDVNAKPFSSARDDGLTPRRRFGGGSAEVPPMSVSSVASAASVAAVAVPLPASMSTCQLNHVEGQALQRLLRKTDIGPFMLGLSVYGGWFAMDSWLGVLVGPLSVTLLYLLFVLMTTSAAAHSQRTSRVVVRDANARASVRRRNPGAPSWSRGGSALASRRPSHQFHSHAPDRFSTPRATGTPPRRSSTRHWRPTPQSSRLVNPSDDSPRP